MSSIYNYLYFKARRKRKKDIRKRIHIKIQYRTHWNLIPAASFGIITFQANPHKGS